MTMNCLSAMAVRVRCATSSGDRDLISEGKRVVTPLKSSVRMWYGQTQVRVMPVFLSWRNSYRSDSMKETAAALLAA